MNVESLALAKKYLRELLDTSYKLISNLFIELNCEKNLILSSQQIINDRNILLYLATIESRVQQLLSFTKRNRKYTEDTTITWRIDQPYNSFTMENNQYNLQAVDYITPQILS